MRDISHRLLQGTTCRRPAKKGSADDRWRPAGGVAIQVDGHSTPRKVGEEK